MLVLVLLMPTIVKFSHHHDWDYNHGTENKSANHSPHKCPICDFQFSIFIAEEFIPSPVHFRYADHYLNQYTQSHLSDNLRFSFLLRAPPVLHLV